VERQGFDGVPAEGVASGVHLGSDGLTLGALYLDVRFVPNDPPGAALRGPDVVRATLGKVGVVLGEGNGSIGVVGIVQPNDRRLPEPSKVLSVAVVWVATNPTSQNQIAILIGQVVVSVH
jgi:hypothetical protein